MEKKKRTRAKLKFGVCIAAFVAALSTFVILLQIEKNTLAQYEKGTICVAAEKIPRGLVITEENCTRYFKIDETDKRCIPEIALKDYAELYGLAPLYDVEKGTLLSAGMFESIDEILQGMEEPVVAGFKAEDLYQVAGGLLRAGDRIHIFHVTEEKKAVLCWENVYIQGVFDQAGKEIPCDDRQTGAQRINVYMDKADMEAFYSDLASGSLRVVKVCD